MQFVKLLHEMITEVASKAPDDPALGFENRILSYSQLWSEIRNVALHLKALGLERDERVAIYLPKCFEAVIGFFAAAAAGGVFVPINPQLKPAQVAHILRDCNVRILITFTQWAGNLSSELTRCPDLRTVVTVESGNDDRSVLPLNAHIARWSDFSGKPGHNVQLPRRIDADMAAILYTSGSSGAPKGVVLSHRNLVAAAQSAAESLDNSSSDRILSVLPLSFDAGLVQVTSAFAVGASVFLLEYLLPVDVISAVVRYRITGVAGVPNLWSKLSRLRWPSEAQDCLRYLTNSGGAMPVTVLNSLHEKLPHTEIILNYGLTEAFRSTSLRNAQSSEHPDSAGKALPNVEILVVREDGGICAPDEPGELVHRGALVALGYWNDKVRTAERFRPAPNQASGITTTEIAVWSGDQVRMDEDGYLYFISRKDEMIKTAGYRVSPTEVEEVAYGSGVVAEAAAIGVPHPELDKAIVLVVVVKDKAHSSDAEDRLVSHFRQELPIYMLPQRIILVDSLITNPNGKIDRKLLTAQYSNLFQKN